MASRRFYAYYIRGSQLALIEHDSVSGDGLNYTGTDINDIGPSGGLQWKSPIASITDGIEVEYAYSPRYFIESTDVSTTTVASWDQDNNGNLRFQLSRDDIPISKRLRMAFMINSDKEYMFGLYYILNKNLSISSHYDSDMKTGIGIKLTY